MASRTVFERNSSSPELLYNFQVKLRSSSTVIEAFSGLVRPEIEDERIDLAKAALTFARIEYPDLDLAVYLRQIDQLGERARKKTPDPGDPGESIAAVNEV